MTFPDTLVQRNEAFATAGFLPGMKMLPSRKTVIVGCVDPRVDPMDVLRLEPGEAAVVRNIGGRVNEALLETLAVLGTVARIAGHEVGAGWNLVLMQHTNCGIVGCHHHAPGLLAKHLGVAEDALPALEIDDPRRGVAVDVAALKANPALPAGLTVTGLVYDVDTGRVETVVSSAPLRAEAG